MRNNKGLGRFETIVVILLVLIVFTFLFKVFLDGSSGKHFDTMRSDALSFGKTVSTNANFYHTSDMVTLAEAIDEKTIGKIKNPVGSGFCDEKESKVFINNGKYLVTLRCGDYLIDSEGLNNMENAPIYEIGEWKEKEFESADKLTLYNCEEAGKEVFSEYYPELYFVYQINKKYSTDYYNVSSVESTCKVLSKEFYREKKEIEE